MTTKQISLYETNRLTLDDSEELIRANTWPNGWEGTEATGDIPMDATIAEGVVQPLLMRER
ncbi:MAG TPA: hypothetical protein VLH56_05190 [Dissulfurispiraceae bacterium]|nr:hypothetical protein [Dissulfurispiraceae bacterium]